MQQSYKLKVLKKNDSAFQFYDILFGVYFLEGDPSFYDRYWILFEHIICISLVFRFFFNLVLLIYV